MSQTINTNVMSLNAQRNLMMSQSSLATAMQRLSSGLRVNSAKDDAAGLAISERFTTQIRGFNQAIRNANDGISLSQVGEGALAELTSNLQRIRELAVQAVNATNSDNDRRALNLEVQQRLAEIDRISSQTTFNGLKLLDGSFKSATFQVGPDAGQVINLNLPSSTRLGAIGQIALTESTLALGDGTSGNIAITPASRSFSIPDFAGTGGFVQFDSPTLPASSNFSTALVDPVPGAAIQTINESNLNFDPTANPPGVVGQFDVTIGATTVGITLTGNFTTAAQAATAIQTQLQAVVPAATASIVNGRLEIRSGSVDPVQISNVDGPAALAGFSSTAGLTGDAAGASSAVRFSVDPGDGSPPILVNLNGNYTSEAGIATAIQTQLGAGFTVTWDATESDFRIRNNTPGSAIPTITPLNYLAYQAGWGTTAVTSSEVGEATTSSNAAIFTIDGLNITLDGNYDSFDDMALELQTKMNAAALDEGRDDEFVVLNNAGTLLISRADLNNNDPIGITAANISATNAGFSTSVVGNEGSVGGQLELPAEGFVISIGQRTFDFRGTYGSAQDLATAINRELEGISAEITANGTLKIQSTTEFTVTGDSATRLGFPTGTITPNTGNLLTSNIETTEAANETIVRVDSALAAVSQLRSTFGAIHNRFESVISNLSTAVENLSASRSRIMDADFAQETAALSRAQILQQAGTAMVAQANQVPQGVLRLLQG